MTTLFKHSPSLPLLSLLSLHCCSIPSLLSPFIVLLLFSSFHFHPHYPSFPSFSSSPTTPPSTPWISVPLTHNYTSTLLSRWLTSSPCNNSLTTEISLPSTPITLPSPEITTLTFHAIDEEGKLQCLGGDYFETDLSSPSWKSRPPVVDHGNGTYSIYLQVGYGFTGEFNLAITLLFRHYLGLKHSPERFKFRKELRNIPVRFVQSSVVLPNLEICKSDDFLREAWSGRWTRHTESRDCEVDEQGRYRCLGPDFACMQPWCHGSLGSLESNGWVYSAHCSFRIFTQESAWQCLDKKWLFFWGDSNHVDTIRNLLTFVFGVTDTTAVQRLFDRNFTSPNGLWSVRITNVFNGHWNHTRNYLGVDSLDNEEYVQLLKGYFANEDSVPDVAMLNSGLHDGVHFRSLKRFALSAERAANFWVEVMRHVDARGKRRPRIFYRTTIATAGYARDLAFNPHKMEVYNGIMVEKIQKKGLLRDGGVVDQFDMSFPWHYDNRYSDGVHYGRAPAKARWRDGKVGHHYFVDLMLCHVLLNAICNE
ncbi:hypothetical protein LUZ61_001778 [Rhynchospora tenuis]|uniref:Uncharacterized protein n=1 Tax=Rhynchospora tenuis TaxID=198213 RepID=A0AAD5ZHN7_9POAL|nr:hypothetical protein LUZ61_001778 [Rhynchospora tenuis]